MLLAIFYHIFSIKSKPRKTQPDLKPKPPNQSKTHNTKRTIKSLRKAGDERKSNLEKVNSGMGKKGSVPLGELVADLVANGLDSASSKIRLEGVKPIAVRRNHLR